MSEHPDPLTEAILQRHWRGRKAERRQEMASAQDQVRAVALCCPSCGGNLADLIRTGHRLALTDRTPLAGRSPLSMDFPAS